MHTPTPAPDAPSRGLRDILYRVSEGDRASLSQADALAWAFSRVPTRGRQQVRRQRHISGLLSEYWLIQDIR